jgi:S-adenosylmethionine hydrolase
MLKGRRRPVLAGRPIIILLSDFGLCDAHAAEMKIAVLKGYPEAGVGNVTHKIPRHDVTAESVQLARIIKSCPPGTMRPAAVDPGVGTAVIHIDFFDIATTSISASLGKKKSVTVGRRLVIHHTYGDVAIGQPQALVGSVELLEIAVREGLAAEKSKLNVGDKVIFS